MNKPCILLFILLFSFSFLLASVNALDTTTITATAIAPNQINLQWSAVPNPGWGYKVEIQNTDGKDTRYASWTDLTASLANLFGYLPYWVTEAHYKDRANDIGTGEGTPSQFSVFGLKYGTTYRFRVRTYAKTDSGAAVHGGYSNEATATTLDAAMGGDGGTYKLKWVDYATGNDNYNGDYETFQGGSDGPWKTFSKACSAATDKTLVLFKASETDAYCSVANSGSSPSSRIIFEGQPGYTVNMTLGSYGTAVGVNGKNYIVFDSFTWIDNTGTGRGNNVVRVLNHGDRIVFANIELAGPGIDPVNMGYGPNYYDSSFNMIYNCYWHNYGDITGGSGGFYLEGDSGHNLFINSRITMFSHGLNSGSSGGYDAVMNCRLSSGAGQGYLVAPSAYCLLEGSVIDNTQHYISLYKPAIQWEGNYGVVRRNVIYDCHSHAIEMRNEAHHNQIYNNVVYGNNGFFVDMMSPGTDHTNNKFYNNIIYKNGGDATGSGYSTPLYLLLRGDVTNNEFKYNMILHSSGGIDYPSATIIGINIIYPSEQKSVADAEVQWPSYCYNNSAIAPTFIDAPNHEFHLQSTSNGIGKAIASTSVGPWGSPIQAGDDYGAFEYYPAASNVHYVSQTGSASWSSCTNINTPCSLATSFANAVAGDTVYIRGGIYINPVYNTPPNSGSDIIFQNYNGESVTFDAISNWWQITSDHHIFDGINFTNVDTNTIGNVAILITGNYNQFRNCDFTSQPGQSYGYVNIRGGQHNTFYNCHFHGNKTFNIAVGYDATWQPGHYNVIDSCLIEGAFEYQVILFSGSTYNQVKNSIIDCGKLGAGQPNGLGISINDGGHSGITSHNLIDNNIIKNMGWHDYGSPQNKNGIQLYGSYNTIRRNRFYLDANRKTPPHPAYCIEGPRYTGGNGNNLIYNNVFYDNYQMGMYIWPDGGGQMVKNNIFYKNMHFNDTNGYKEGSQISWNYFTDNQVQIFNNFVQYINTGHIITTLPGPSTYTLAQCQINWPNTWANNIEAAGGPGFISEDSASPNFLKLVQGSPCIDAGVVVNDMDWGNLPYSGSAPDIGAFEYTAPSQTCTDIDGDAYGNPASSTCNYPQLDCDDNNASINPGSSEICGNGIDEDCNGEDLQCNPADTNQDGCVSDPELSAFIDRWKLNSSDVTLREIIEAIGLWKKGC